MRAKFSTKKALLKSDDGNGVRLLILGLITCTVVYIISKHGKDIASLFKPHHKHLSKQALPTIKKPQTKIGVDGLEATQEFIQSYQ